MLILEDFKSLFKTNDNKLVRYFFYSMLRDSVKNQPISCANFVTVVWNPFFQKCCRFLNDVKKKSIKLKEILTIDRDCTSSEQLENELIKLCCGVENCHDNKKLERDHRWISESVMQIKTYLSMCDQAKAADTVLEIKEKLKLSGNFDIVECVAQKVSETLQDQPLSSIDVNMGALASFLQDMASSEEKKNCIETFSDCMDIVNWIKNGNITI